MLKKMYPKEFKKFKGNETFEDLQKLLFGHHSILVRIDSIKNDIFYFIPIVNENQLDLKQFQSLIEE